MSAKHFRMIAGAIASIDNETARYSAARALAEVCAAANPRFDVGRFMLACKAVDLDDSRR